MTQTQKILLTLSFCFTVFSLLLIINRPNQALGSVSYASEYHATTTDTNFTASGKLIQSGQGTFGSLVVTKTSNAIIEFYDATTTSNHSDHATTSLAKFPLTTVGTYTFDVIYTRGLVVVVDTAVGVASSTITYR